MPITPLHTIMIAANTESRAKVSEPGPSRAISVTISDTSMMVTASASTKVPYGSPTRRAIASAWATDTNTNTTCNATSTALTSTDGVLPHVRPTAASPTSGATNEPASSVRWRVIAPKS